MFFQWYYIVKVGWWWSYKSIWRESHIHKFTALNVTDVNLIISQAHLHFLSHSQMWHQQSHPPTQEFALKRQVASMSRLIPGCHIKAIAICLSRMKLNGQMQPAAVQCMVRDTFTERWTSVVSVDGVCEDLWLSIWTAPMCLVTITTKTLFFCY